jgi:hypothetical protein
MLQQGKPPRGCLACHESPHEKRFLAGAFALAGGREELGKGGTGCLVCHEAEHDSFRDERLVLSREQHASSGFSLDAPHDDASCTDCHAEPSERAAYEQRFPGRGPDDCGACHEDPHGGQFKTGPFAKEGCVACHERKHFEPHAFDLTQHARAALPIDGSHAQVACNVCHLVPGAGEARRGRRSESEPPRVFRGTPARCELCHQDGHKGFFEPFAEQLAGVDRGSCAECHQTTAFGDVPAGRFDHGRWTGLDIHGAHAQTSCTTCHPRARRPDENGRTLGWVAEHFGTFDGCETCHADPHRDEFDDVLYDGVRSVDRTANGRVDCGTCHEQSSFRAFPDGFDHGGWTGFELDGAHAATDCSSCHAPQVADEVGRSWGRARGNLCSDCHANPHAGQFKPPSGGETDCRRCHESAAGFGKLVFDHDRDSRFALEKTHSKLACAACHQPWQTSSGPDVVRYRPLGTECVDCHGKHDDQGSALKRRKR